MLKPKRKTGEIREQDLIQAILDANEMLVSEIITEKPEAINAQHQPTGMNAAMLAIYGRLGRIFDVMIMAAGGYLIFEHTDVDGDDLQEIAFSTLDPKMIDAVQAAYEQHAAHIINNWPEP